MLKEELQQVKEIARQIAREEITEALKDSASITKEEIEKMITNAIKTNLDSPVKEGKKDDKL